ncbi:hypothetical protein, partial [Actinoplanes sp. ATCC 53533]|uniref:hypothetical protein n=2 Tax=Actinoplanes sp. ATCC 53533 TaxID=1288362 RepID=UPI0011D0ABF7
MLAPFVAAMLIVFPASAAWAHPLDITWQTSYLTLTAGKVDVEIKISVGALVAPALLTDLDRDTDHSLSGDEGNDYASRVLAKIALRIDDTAIPLSVARVDLPDYTQTQAGYGVLRIKATGSAPAAGTHSLFYRNDFAPEKPRYQVTVAGTDGVSIPAGTLSRDQEQQQVRTDFTVATPTGTPTTAAAQDDTTDTWSAEHLLATMRDPSRSPWIIIVAIGLAM